MYTPILPRVADVNRLHAHTPAEAARHSIEHLQDIARYAAKLRDGLRLDLYGEFPPRSIVAEDERLTKIIARCRTRAQKFAKFLD